MAVQGMFQPGLFGSGVPSAPPGFAGVERWALGRCSWVEHAPGWLPGADELFERLVEGVGWQQGRRRMYDRTVDEPRLTSWYPRTGPLPHPILAELFVLFDQRYGRVFDSTGLNLYRDGNDSVAWHGDRVAHGGRDAIVAIVSLGEPRPFLVRPRGGGPSRSVAAGGGDLLVMGGDCQREFEHCVPKVARAGPRLSVTFRHGPLRPLPGRVTRAVEPTRVMEGRHREASLRPPEIGVATGETPRGRPGAGQEAGAAASARARARARPSSTVAIRPSSWAS